VQPGVTYRDIGIRLTITSIFADIERIVAEALGEVPANDDNGGAPPPTVDEPAQSNTINNSEANATKSIIQPAPTKTPSRLVPQRQAKRRP